MKYSYPCLAHNTPFGRMYSRSLKGDPQYPSITTVISQEQSNRLNKWFAYVAANYVVKDPLLRRILLQSDKIDESRKLRYLLYKASNAAEYIGHAAAQRGNRVHYYCEQVARKYMGKNHEIQKALDCLEKNNEINFAHVFDKWWNDYNVKPILTEITVWNNLLGYAGTLDLVATINGKICLIDFKTKGLDKKGNLKKIDNKVVMQLLAGLHAEESLENPDTGKWRQWKYRKSVNKNYVDSAPILLGVAIGENKIKIMKANPSVMENYWNKFCTLLKLWKDTHKIYNGQKALIPILKL